MKEENCPCCPNHCDKENLSCGRGREFFRGSTKNTQEEPTTLEEKVIFGLRKCGHRLHHNRDLNPNKMLSNLTEEELNMFHELLSKIG